MDVVGVPAAEELKAAREQLDNLVWRVQLGNLPEAEARALAAAPLDIFNRKARAIASRLGVRPRLSNWHGYYTRGGSIFNV